DDGNDVEILAGTGGHAYARRFPRFSTGGGRANLDDISRMDRLRTSTQWTRNCRINDVEHHGAVSAGTVCAQLRGCSASHDRGEKAGLRGYVQICRRSAIHTGSGEGDALEGPGEKACG